MGGGRHAGRKGAKKDLDLGRHRSAIGPHPRSRMGAFSYRIGFAVDALASADRSESVPGGNVTPASGSTGSTFLSASAPNILSQLTKTANIK